MRILFLVVIMLTYCSSNAADTAQYSCKYRYIKQKDSTDINSKFDDIMILTINNKSSIFYSYLKQFGLRNMENDETKNDYNIIGNSVLIEEGKTNKYFTNSESEIITIDFKNKSIFFFDKFLINSYKYIDTLTVPVWQIGTETMVILNQVCQIATTNYRGRKYTAWFAPSIPFRMGPWLFNGLPGLILKVSDSKKQFLFECIELNTPITTTKVFKLYTNPQKITKKILQNKKKLSIQNPIAFMGAESGVSITATDKSGNSVSTNRPNKPYNPIDLTQ